MDGNVKFFLWKSDIRKGIYEIVHAAKQLHKKGLLFSSI